jgi:glycosyltransferase involved in cell wall biosynthesis
MLERARVVAVAASYAPMIGGGERYAERYLAELTARGAQVDVVTSVDGCSGEHRVGDVRVHYVSPVRVFGFPVLPLGRIAKIAADANANVVQSFGPAIHDLYVASFAGFTRRLYYQVYHADFLDNKGIGRIATGLHNALALGWARRIISTNPENTERLRGRGVAPERILTLTPGVDARFFDARPDRAIDVLFVGALDEYHQYKRLDLLLEAAARSRAEGDRWSIAVVGKGDRLEAFRALAHSLGLGEDVTFHGFIPDDELPSFYASCRAFVLPSPTTQEGFGLVCLEALAAGAPVVCSRNAGVRSTIESITGCAVWDGENLESLVAAVRAARHDTARAERRAAAQAFTWGAMGTELAAKLDDDLSA